MDVGTGDGSFLLELLSAGFHGVVGIEPSGAPIAVAHPDVRPMIRQEVFRPGAFPEGSFSLVTCFQTIEHLDDPVALCRDALSALKPGGALFLIGHDHRAPRGPGPFPWPCRPGTSPWSARTPPTQPCR